jgi:hypothetical protein
MGKGNEFHSISRSKSRSKRSDSPFTSGSERSDSPLTSDSSRSSTSLDMMKLQATQVGERVNRFKRPEEATESHQVQPSDCHLSAAPRSSLLYGVMRIVKQDRQAGLARSMAPDTRNMTAQQFVLEALSDKRWPTRLQEQGIPLNRQTLDLLHTILFENRPASPRESNEAIRNFKDVARQLGYKELKIKEVGLHGGIVGTYYPALDAYESRIATFRDPEENLYIFNKGEYDHDIALQMQGRLTEQETYGLLRGSQIDGWTCDVETNLFAKVDYYTDAGNVVHALTNVDQHYASFTIDEHMAGFPDQPPIEYPTPRYNCFAIFIGEQGYVPGMHGQIADIIRDHEYYAVRLAYVKAGDLAFYYRPDEFPHNPYNNREELWRNEPPHVAEVVEVDGEGNILVSNKPGDYGRLGPLDAYDPAITGIFGDPVFARTDRPMGHHLHNTPPRNSDSS